MQWEWNGTPGMGEYGKRNMKRLRNMTLFQKFAATIIFLGLIPMLILSIFISNIMIQDYRNALKMQYEQAAYYVGSSMETMLNTYDTISQMPYNYNYGNELMVARYQTYDNLRQIVQGDKYRFDGWEEERDKEMDAFLQYVAGADEYLLAAHFTGVDGQGEPLDFHYSSYSTFFKGMALYENAFDQEKVDKESNKLLLVPKHHVEYFSGIHEPVFTVARNYFDLRNDVGNAVYVGTLFLDVRMKRLEQIFHTVKFSGAEEIYIVNDAGDCFYSNNSEKIGTNIGNAAQGTRGQLVLTTKANDYGLHVVVVMDMKTAFSDLRTLQNLMYVILGASMLALVASSVLFSKRLVKPIHAMMAQMEQVENGNFEIQLPVQSTDEIGTLSERFNEMSEALKNYINKYYVAQIRQTEAELTALKSQIYPHFLYNTLEIIRMTAVENDDNKVSEMIEALSVQIHYLIGRAEDMVTIEKEIEIIRKYIYLLNCRITCKLQLLVPGNKNGGILIPKLILQPIVENAYVHGIKPKNGNGCISIDTQITGEDVEISVMDNGVGMDQRALDKIQELLQGDDPGIKNEYNWQSIGMKNIHDRLRFLYGGQYGIQVTSNPNVGTIVSVRMPVIRAGETENQELAGWGKGTVIES